MNKEYSRVQEQRLKEFYQARHIVIHGEIVLVFRDELGSFRCHIFKQILKLYIVGEMSIVHGSKRRKLTENMLHIPSIDFFFSSGNH